MVLLSMLLMWIFGGPLFMFQSKRSTNKYAVYNAMRNYEYETNSEHDAVAHTSEEEWREIVTNEMKNVSSYKYMILIFHDKDTLENGDPKGLHCHILTQFFNPRNEKNVRLEINPYNTREQNCSFASSEGGSARYLTHLSEQAIKDKKHIYDMSELIAFTRTENTAEPVLLSQSETKQLYKDLIAMDFETDETTTKRQAKAIEKFLREQIYIPITNGIIRPDDVPDIIISEFGIEDFTKIYTNPVANQINNLFKAFISRIKNQSRRTGSRLSNIYIHGDGGLGKSAIADELAKHFASKDGMTDSNIFPGSATGNANTMFSGYQNEHIAVFNEIEPDTMTQAKFCVTFDMHKPKQGENRYANIINTSRYAIFTKSDDFEHFSETIGMNVKNTNTADLPDKIWQVRRRFECIINITDEFITLSRYEKENKTEPKIIKQFATPKLNDLINPTKYTKEIFDEIYNACQFYNEIK